MFSTQCGKTASYHTFSVAIWAPKRCGKNTASGTVQRCSKFRIVSVKYAVKIKQPIFLGICQGVGTHNLSMEDNETGAKQSSWRDKYLPREILKT